MHPTTLETIDSTILKFCRSVVPDARPEFVPVRPEPYAEYGHCASNVRGKVARDGGGFVAGWVVWLLPGLFVEAERHAVWRSPAGDLVDVTPKPDGERRILFVPEPASKWCGLTLVLNVFRALSDHPITPLLWASKLAADVDRVRRWGLPAAVAEHRAAEARIVPEGNRIVPEWVCREASGQAKRRKKDRRDERKRKRNSR